MLTDSHCHLDRLNLDPYGGGLDEALDAARARGVERFLCISIDTKNAQQVVDIAKKYSDVYATVGLHPLEFNNEDGAGCEDIQQWLLDMAQQSKVLGVGETGLDYYYSSNWVEKQKKSFEIHLKVAKSVKKPVIVHTRDAREDTIELIKQYGCLETGGVLHCFTESWEMARAGLDLNYFVSFSGIITFKNAQDLRDVVAKVPMERILVETDSPYLAPVPFRGKPNEPKNVVEVAQCIAEIKGISYEEVCEVSGANFERLFGLRAA